MKEANSNLEYVSKVLQRANASGCAGVPGIYVMWGVIVFAGYAMVEFYEQYSIRYWIIASVFGGLLSWWLGARADKNLGQQDRELGLKYMKHFLVMTLFIFTAVFTSEYASILLLLGMAYSLAAIYLDKVMFVAGGIAWLVYLGVYFGIITSALVVGGVLAVAFFISAWAAARANGFSDQPL